MKQLTTAEGTVYSLLDDLTGTFCFILLCCLFRKDLLISLPHLKIMRFSSLVLHWIKHVCYSLLLLKLVLLKRKVVCYVAKKNKQCQLLLSLL